MAEQDELGNFAEDLAQGYVAFVVAKRPADRLDVQFEGFEVDGVPVPLDRPRPLPADQGYYIAIGAFTVGVEIEVRWQVHTGIDVPDGEVLFGHCPNFKLTRLVRLERRKVDSFTTYSGVFKVTPERP